MCNELHFSSEVALDGSSWHLWLRHEVEVVPHRQSAAGEEREGAGSRQGFFALLMHERGRGHGIEIASMLASSSLVSCSPENREHQRRSPAGAAVPTKRCVRADQALCSDDANAPHGVDEEEAWPPAGIQPMEAPPHIADASGRSRCGE